MLIFHATGTRFTVARLILWAALAALGLLIAAWITVTALLIALPVLAIGTLVVALTRGRKPGTPRNRPPPQTIEGDYRVIDIRERHPRSR